MAFKREHVEQWVADRLPGERVVSHVATAIWSADHHTRGPGTIALVTVDFGTGGNDARIDLAETLQLDPDRQLGAGISTTFYALTDRQLVLGTRSSVRNRPKELLHAAPIDAVQVHWFDDDTIGDNLFRHFVTVFGDGAWRADKTGIMIAGKVFATATAREYVDALGDRAIGVTGA